VLKFGIIAEGPCDQAIIENVLLGYFQDEEEEPAINYVQPPPATSARPVPPQGWTLVFENLQRGEPQKALQYNDYVVIHIDTDVQDETGFDVPRRERGKELSIPERVERVIARLRADIDAAFFQAHAQQIIFAVAVDSIECWVLPLLHTGNKANKTTGCLKAADMALRKANKNGLASAAGEKFPPAYDAASRGYLKRGTLTSLGLRNPSLKIFLERLDEARPT
jgi:hypothetical protein